MKLRRVLLAAGIALAVVLIGFGLYVLRPEPSEAEHIEQARAYQADGDLDAAIVELQGTLLEQPNSIDARWLLSELYLLQRNGADALAQLERAQELGVSGREFNDRWVSALLMDRQFDKALARLAFMSPTAEDTSVLILRGRARLGLGRFDEAREAFEEALRMQPDNPDARIGLATTAFALNNVEEAQRLTEDALAQSPDNYLGWMLKGEIAMSLQNAAAAQQAFEGALRIVAGDLPAQLAIVQALLVQQKFEEAGANLNALIEEYPKHPGLLFLAAQNELAGNNNIQAAESALTVALNQSPDDTSALLLMAWVMLMKGDLESALENLNAHQVLLPGDPAGSKLLAYVLLRRGELLRGIEVLQRAVDKSPTDMELVTLLGDAYLQAGEQAKANPLFSRAVGRVANNAPIRTQWATSLLATADTEGALRELESAVAVDPDYARAQFLLARLYYQLGNYEQTLASATRLAEKYPQDPRPYVLMAAVSEAGGDGEGARAFYQQGLDLAPTNILARYNLARLARENGDLETARERFQGVLLAQPGHLPSVIALAQIALDTGQPQDALALLEQAREKNPDAVGLALELADMYGRMGRHADALVAAQDAAALAPYDPAARLVLGRAQLRADQLDKARETLRGLVLQAPESADAHFELAKLQLKDREPRGASASLEQALLLAPERIDINVLKGELLLAQGEADSALAIALRLQEAHPGSPEGDILAGRALMAQQQPEAAIAAYEQAVAKSAARGPMMKLQAAYRQIGNTAKADVILRNWLSAHANDVPIRIMLATSMMQADELDLAEREYLQALNYQPDNAILHNNLAWLYSQSADPRAEEHARRALELLPDNPNVLDTYGWILAQGESPHQGLALLEKAIERSPGDALIRYHLAGTLALIGQPYQARRELETILESNQTAVDRQVLEQAIRDLEVADTGTEG
jgi:putative PEP-CTERM system TPR-repeat lipoprotein